jgi:hypothetical protein
MSEFLAAVIGAIVGCAGAYATSYFMLQKQRRLEAAAKFREAFVEVVALCKSNREIEIRTIGFDSLVEHEKAVILYEPFLSKNELAGFRSAWNKYCENHRYRNLNDFVPEGGINNENVLNEVSEKEQRAINLSFYSKLLSYAPVR